MLLDETHFLAIPVSILFSAPLLTVMAMYDATMEVNGRNTSASSCDSNRNGIDSQRRQNGGYSSSTREHSGDQ
ncbi:unnamed protein product [Thelazia callipaeda]|uniref:Neur_chan_memb domain-containing protein n=1 Tax=Thelazia callipaeda TaxID=103827 RepID=A0A0N5D4X7_THECL|nr:unnamed protein product [Thelazia callipaeda]